MPPVDLLAWTPAVDQAGKHVVTLIATDAGGASAIESFEFDVLGQNTTPSINSTAPVEVSAGAVFMYDVLASDADLDQLHIRIDRMLRLELRSTPSVASAGRRQ